MYRKPRNPNKRAAVRAARRMMAPPMHRAMDACRVARSVGLIVLAAHAINGCPRITVVDPNCPETRAELRL